MTSPQSQSPLEPQQGAARVLCLPARDGQPAAEVVIRPIDPADAPALQLFHDRLSDRSVYLRYLAPKPVLSDDEARRLTGVDHDNREAFVAVVGGEDAGAGLVGVGRFETVPARTGQAPDQAEVAFVVEDAWQGRGIAQALLARLAEAAVARGLTELVAEVHPSNGRMLAVFRRWPGGCELTHEAGAVQAVLHIAAGPGGRMQP